jgi:hypothetical protein
MPQIVVIEKAKPMACRKERTVVTGNPFSSVLLNNQLYEWVPQPNRLRRSVRATVVDNDDLVGRSRLAHDALNSVEQALALIVC